MASRQFRTIAQGKTTGCRYLRENTYARLANGRCLAVAASERCSAVTCSVGVNRYRSTRRRFGYFSAAHPGTSSRCRAERTIRPRRNCSRASRWRAATRRSPIVTDSPRSTRWPRPSKSSRRPASAIQLARSRRATAARRPTAAHSDPHVVPELARRPGPGGIELARQAHARGTETWRATARRLILQQSCSSRLHPSAELQLAGGSTIASTRCRDGRGIPGAARAGRGASPQSEWLPRMERPDQNARGTWVILPRESSRRVRTENSDRPR